MEHGGDDPRPAEPPQHWPQFAFVPWGLHRGSPQAVDPEGHLSPAPEDHEVFNPKTAAGRRGVVHTRFGDTGGYVLIDGYFIVAVEWEPAAGGGAGFDRGTPVLLTESGGRKTVAYLISEPEPIAKGIHGQ